MQDVAVLAFDGVVAFDLSIPCEVFGHVVLPDGSPAYRVMVCGERKASSTRAFRIQTSHGLIQVATADIVVIPGTESPDRTPSPEILKAIASAWRRGATIASICTGAFILAATGLLNGRRATTHWIAADRLAALHPLVEVDRDVLFIDEGRLLTSAGASAGLDLCLHMVGRDHGQAVATEAARLAVAPLIREGGQKQFIRHEPVGSDRSLALLLEWMLQEVDKPVDVASLASRAGLSPRTFARRFRDQTGTSPVQWLLTARVRRAQELLETTDATIVEVAAASGFESPVTFRARFQRLAGVTPTTYRRRFNAGWPVAGAARPDTR